MTINESKQICDGQTQCNLNEMLHACTAYRPPNPQIYCTQCISSGLPPLQGHIWLHGATSSYRSEEARFAALSPEPKNVTKRVEVPVLISAWRGVCTQIQPECVISLQMIFPVLPPQLHLQQVCTKSASGECGF